MNDILYQVVERHLATNETLNELEPNTTFNSSVSMGKKNTGDQHIADFKSFFNISTGFIIYFALYLIVVPLVLKFVCAWNIRGFLLALRRKGLRFITVRISLEVYNFVQCQILMLIYIILVLVVPFCALCLWGALITFNDNFSYQFGIGLALIGIFLLYSLLGFINWYGHKWYLDMLSRILFTIAFIAAFSYCFIVLFIPSYFTYNGCTAIFFSLNFVCVCYLAQTKDRHSRIGLKVLVNKLVERKIQILDEEDNEKIKDILEESKAENGVLMKKKRLVAFLFYFLSLGGYAIIIASENEPAVDLVGVVNIVVLLITDTIVYVMEDRASEKFIYQDFFKSIYYLFTRFVCCFQLYYWLCMQSLIFFVTTFLMAIHCTHQYINRKSNNSTHLHGLNALYSECPTLLDIVQSKMKELYCRNQDEYNLQRRLPVWRQFLSGFIYLIYLLAFTALTVATLKDIPGIRLKTLTFVNTFKQQVIAAFSLLFAVVCGLVYTWFQLFWNNKFRFEFQYLIMFLIIEGISVFLGIIFFFSIQIRINLIWTSFVILPVVGCTYLFFVGIWITNDYNIFEKESNQVGEVSILRQDAVFNGKQFFTNLGELFMCNYLPKTRKDKMAFRILMANIISIIVYLFVTMFAYSPWWVGFTIAFWIGIIELSILVSIKFYQTYFQFTFMVQAGAFFIIVLFTIWTVIMGIHVMTIKNKTDLVCILFYFTVFGYLALYPLSIALQRYHISKDYLSAPTYVSVLFTISCVAVAVCGALIIITTSYDILGQGLCGLGGYCVLMVHLPRHYKRVTIVFGSVLICYALFIIINYNKKSAMILQGLSLILVTVFFFFALCFIQKMYLNRQTVGKQIFLYSRTLFPALKYIPSTMEMKYSNQELVFFFLMGFTFVIWSFLASILLKVQDRYIGISSTALAIALTYLYINDRLKNATEIQLKDFKDVGVVFYKECLLHALLIRQKWRENQNNFKEVTLNDRAGLRRQTTSIKRLDLRQQLHVHEEWLSYEYKVCKEVGGLFRVLNMFKRNYKYVNYTDKLLKRHMPDIAGAHSVDYKFDLLLKLQHETEQEALYDIQFWAFLNGYMTLKLSNLLTDQKNLIFNLIEQFKQKQSETNNVLENFSYDTLPEYIKDSENKSKFQSFLEEFKTLEDVEQQQRMQQFDLDIQRMEERRRRTYMPEYDNLAEDDKDQGEVDAKDISIFEHSEEDTHFLADQQFPKRHSFNLMDNEAQNKREELDMAQYRQIQVLVEQQIDAFKREQERVRLQYLYEQEKKVKEEMAQYLETTFKSKMIQIINEEKKLRLSQEEKEMKRKIREETLSRLKAEEEARIRYELEKQLREFEAEQIRKREEEMQRIEEERVKAIEKMRIEAQREKRRQELERLKREKEEQEREARRKEALKQQEEKRRRDEQRRFQEEQQRQREIEWASEHSIDGPSKIEERANVGQVPDALIKASLEGVRMNNKAFDEQLLINEGNKLYNQIGPHKFTDPTFDKRKALGPQYSRYQWLRIEQMEAESDSSSAPKPQVRNNARQETISSQFQVFVDGTSASDIFQGELGDCYLLSAMSVIAHSRPQLLQKIFHPMSKVVQKNGMYVLMFYRNRKPVIIQIDDYFPCHKRLNTHAYVKVKSSREVNEIWPMLIEKAYAKMYGSYPRIEGGLVDAAFEDLTNGAPDRYDLTEQSVKTMYNTGLLWDKLVYWSDKKYLMGAGSPQGSDRDVSRLGIVQGHAYSVLDVCEIDGNRLIQLRNPWGDTTEWKGAWADNSAQWNERRKRMVYDRMIQKGYQVSTIGDKDGIFWMALSDFIRNFEQLFLCRFFDDDWVEITYQGEWSRRLGTAGGCTNYETVGNNPQLQLLVTGHNNGAQPVEIFCSLSQELKPSSANNNMHGIGFEIYDLEGKKMRKNRPVKIPKFECNGGYQVARAVSLDASIIPQRNPYTLLITTYEPNQDAKFTFTLWYKKDQGTVQLTEFSKALHGPLPPMNAGPQFNFDYH